MRKLILLVFLLAASQVEAAPAFDAFTSCGGSTASPLVCSHTPVGDPKGVVAFINTTGTAGDQVTSCTYGGAAMTEVASSPQDKATGETGIVHAFFIGSSIPTGMRDVSCVLTNTTQKRVAVYSWTASADMEVLDSDFVNSDTAGDDPQRTLSVSGRSSVAMLTFITGENDGPDVGVLNGSWTEDVEGDVGLVVFANHSYRTPTTSDIVAGWAIAGTVDDDGIAVMLAIAEVAGGGGGDTRKCLSGGGVFKAGCF
jgi:hypothetical protein